jgi:hypothetical protein
MLEATLVVRTGEGTEPADLARLPGVAMDDDPVDAVICPAICESYPSELAAAGVPIIASAMASLDGSGPDPYNAAAFARAIADALGKGHVRGADSAVATDLVARIRAELLAALAQ